MNLNTIKQVKKKWILGFVLFLIANVIFLRIYLYSPDVSETQDEQVKEVYSPYMKGDYKPIVDKRLTPGEDEGGEYFLYTILSLIKLGYYEEAWTLAQSSSASSDDFLLIYKVLLLWKKSDYEGMILLLNKKTSDDPTIRSVYVQLKAKAYYERKTGNKKTDEQHMDNALTLSKEVTKLDSLSPAGLFLEALVEDKKGNMDKKDVLSLLDRAEKLGYNFTHEYLFLRGRMEYLNRTDLVGEYLVKLVDVEEYQEKVLDLLGDFHFRRSEYKESLDFFKKRADLYPNVGNVYRDVATVYRYMEDRENAKTYMKKQIDASGGTISILSYTVLASSYANDTDAVDYYIGELRKKVSLPEEESAYAYTILINNFLEAGLDDEVGYFIEKGLSYIENISDEERKGMSKKSLDRIEGLKNTVAKYTIHRFIQAYLDRISWVEFHEDLIQNQSSLVDNHIFATLGFSLQGDQTSALRALQSFNPKATPKDVQTITMLHHILIDDPVSAATILSEREYEEPIDLDYLWMKRKLREMDDDTKELLGQISPDNLRSIRQLTGVKDQDMQAGFEKHFHGRLKYMKQYYPEEE